MTKKIKADSATAKKLKTSADKKKIIQEHVSSGEKLATLKLGKLMLIKIPHGNFPVPKSRLYWCEFMQCYHNASERTVQQDCCFGVKPIVVSETEVIKPDEWMYDESPEKGLEQIRKCPGPNDYLGGGHFKILMMPLHFSEEQIQMIVEEKLKDGDPIKI